MLVQDIQIKDLERREAAAYKRAEALDARLREVELELATERGRRHVKSWLNDLNVQDLVAYAFFVTSLAFMVIVILLLALLPTPHGH